MPPYDYLVVDIHSSFEGDDEYRLTPMRSEGSDTNYLLSYKVSLGHTYSRTEGQVRLTHIQAEAVSALCQSMNIRFIPKDFVAGLDGVTTTITVVQGLNNLQMRWWSKTPTEWEPVEQLIEMLRQIARNLTPKGAVD
jgi:hypothetical protein